MGFLDLLDKGAKVLVNTSNTIKNEADKKRADYDKHAQKYYEKYKDNPEQIKKDYKDGKIKGQDARYAGYAYQNMKKEDK